MARGGGSGAVTSLREVLADYLRMRRALGYKLEAPGRQLHQS
jgi:hypothetical protein